MERREGEGWWWVRVRSNLHLTTRCRNLHTLFCVHAAFIYDSLEPFYFHPSFTEVILHALAYPHAFFIQNSQYYSPCCTMPVPLLLLFLFLLLTILVFSTILALSYLSSPQKCTAPSLKNVSKAKGSERLEMLK